MKRKILLVVGFIAVAVGFALFLKVKLVSDGDPDRYYHIALSKITAESGRPFLRSLPQVEDLGWGDYFVDKEFLFHEVTTLGYVIGGERGVEESSFLCSILCLMVFYFFAAGRIPIPGPWRFPSLCFPRRSSR
ncbi:MAG: hypothetical protein ACXWSC_06845 [Bdellovibrionota bacterium]